MDLIDNLAFKAKNNQLPHFVIFESFEQEKVSSDCISLISKIYNEEENIQIIQEQITNQVHPNIFWPEDPEGKSYTIEKIQRGIEFLAKASTNSKPKFFVISNISFLNELALNKLLKNLEEPIDNQYIWFLNPEKKEILPTIKSRAIIIRFQEKAFKKVNLDTSLFQLADYAINQFEKSTVEKYSDILENHIKTGNGLNDCFKDIQKNPKEIKALINVVQRVISNHSNSSFQELNEYLKINENLETYYAFNQGPISILLPLIELLKRTLSH